MKNEWPDDPVFRFRRLLKITGKASLLVSSGMVTAVKAQDIELNTPDAPVLSAKTSTQEQSAATAADTAPLIVPVSMLDQNNTALIRRLLLTHGIEIDLSPGEPLSVSGLAELVRAATAKNLAGGTLDIVLKPSDGSKTESTLTESIFTESAPERILKLGPQDVSVSISDWNVRWLSTPPVTDGNVTYPEKTVIVDGDFTIELTPPPGFDERSFTSLTTVDVHLNSDRIGSARIKPMLDSFTFDNAQAVAEMIDNVVDRDALINLLSEPLESNTSKVCIRPGDPPDCGAITPSPIGAIYDDLEQRVDLFISPALVDPTAKPDYLTPSDTGYTGLLHVHALASHVAGDDNELDASARARIGFGTSNLSSEFDFNSRTDRKRLLDLKLTHYYPDHELVVGTYDSQSGGGFSNIRLLGASLETSDKTRIGLRYAFGSRLDVYLDRSATVQLAIDDRVYSGQVYPAGTQYLDTSALPDGSHEVEIRIMDPVTGLRTERAQFTKYADIPPSGEINYRVTAGVPLVFNQNHIFPTLTDHTFFNLAFSGRLTNRSSLTVGLLQLDNDSILQSELLFFKGYHSVRMALGVGEHQTLSSEITASYQRNRFSIQFRGERFESDFNVGEDPVQSQIFRDDFERYNLTASKSFGGSSVGLTSALTNRKEPGEESSFRRHSVYYRRPLTRRRDFNSQLRTSFEIEEDKHIWRLELHASLDRNNWRYRALAGSYLPEDSDAQWETGIDADWRSNAAESIKWGTGIYTRARDDFQSAGARWYLDHPNFTADASTLRSESSQQDQQSSFASLDANVGADNQGIAFGGSDFAQTGVIISVEGEPNDALFDIYVNGSKASTGKIGSPQFIGLQPFREHSIYLVPQTLLSNDIDEDVFNFTLYPGTVERIGIVAKRKVLMLATLVNQYGEAIINAVIDPDGEPMLVDSDGVFQSEVTPGTQLRVRTASDEECEFTVPEADGNELLVLDTPILCAPVTSATMVQ